MALQLGEDLFLESTLGFDDFLNHSCDPNCVIDFERLELIAGRDIRRGDELTYDYHNSEWDLIAQGCAFDCRCGTPGCVGRIRGFRYLSRERQERLLATASPFIRRQYQAARAPRLRSLAYE